MSSNKEVNLGSLLKSLIADRIASGSCILTILSILLACFFVSLAFISADLTEYSATFRLINLYSASNYSYIDAYISAINVFPSLDSSSIL